MKYRFVFISIILQVVMCWFLHGLDMQYYTIRDNRLFDINLYLSLIFIITSILLLLLSIDVKEL